MVVAVDLAHHAVAEPVGGRGKLHRHIGRLLEAVEAAPLFEDLCDDALLGDALDEIVQHHPLIVPGHDLAGLCEDLADRRARRRQLIAHLVVEFQHRQMRLCDQQVFIVAVIADQRKTFGTARQIVAGGDGHIAERHADGLADQQFRTRALAVELAGIARVKLPAAIRTEAIDAIQIERRRAEILNCVGIGLPFRRTTSDPA